MWTVTKIVTKIGRPCFLWALRSGQFEDLDGAAWRALHDAHDDRFKDGTPSS